jgi:hypothetical protein
VLRDHVLGLPYTPRPHSGDGVLTLGALLPSRCDDLLHTDSRSRELSEGRGKRVGTDLTSSGYDYAIAS